MHALLLPLLLAGAAALPGLQTLDEDGSRLIAITDDALSGELTAAFSRLPDHGTLQLQSPTRVITIPWVQHNATGVSPSVRYVPDRDYNGPDSFGVFVTDGASSVAGDVLIEVTPINDDPQAAALEVDVDEDAIVVITLTISDLESNNNQLTTRITRLPTSGALFQNNNVPITSTATVLSTRERVKYWPDPDVNGDGLDSFDYSVTDPDGGSDEQTVTINVNSVNDLPVVKSTFGGCIEFPTNFFSYAELDSLDPLFSGAEATVEAWVLPYNVASTKFFVALNGANGGNAFLFGIRQGVLTVVVGEAVLSTGITPEVAVPHFYSVVLESVSASQVVVTLYRDCVPIFVSEPIANPTLDVAVTPWTFGAEYDLQALTDFFFGKMDEIRFWDRPLTQAEICAKMVGPITAPEADLVGRWGLDDAVRRGDMRSTATVGPDFVVGHTRIVLPQWSSLPPIAVVAEDDAARGANLPFPLSAFDIEDDDTTITFRVDALPDEFAIYSGTPSGQSFTRGPVIDSARDIGVGTAAVLYEYSDDALEYVLPFDRFGIRATDSSGQSAQVDAFVFVTPVNDAPTLGAPDASDFAQVPLGDAQYNIPVYTLADDAMDTAEVRTVMSCTQPGCTVGLSSQGVAAVSLEGPNGASTISFVSSLEGTREALNQARYAPPASYVGDDTITVEYNDQGGTGTGQARSTTDSVTVTVDGSTRADRSVVIASDAGLRDGTVAFTKSFRVQTRDQYGNNRRGESPAGLLVSEAVAVVGNTTEPVTSSVSYSEAGVYLVTYTATLATTFFVSVSFDGELLSDSPYEVSWRPDVAVAEQSRAYGEGLEVGAQYQRSVFFIDANDIFENLVPASVGAVEFDIELKSGLYETTAEVFPVGVDDRPDEMRKVELWHPDFNATQQLTAVITEAPAFGLLFTEDREPLFEGMSLVGAPPVVEFSPRPNMNGYDRFSFSISDGTLGIFLTQYFDISVSGVVNAAELNNTVQPRPGDSVRSVDGIVGSGTYLATYTPEAGGQFAVSIKLDRLDIRGSPYLVDVFVECSVGQFAETLTGPCRLCPSNTYKNTTSNFDGNVFGPDTCTACPLNTFSSPGSTEVIDCFCKNGFYAPDLGNPQACSSCPSGGVCDGGVSLPYAAPGYWPSPDEQGIFIQCHTPEACVGGADFRCGDGYIGRICGSCDGGFFELNGQCEPCPPSSGSLMFVFVIVAVMFSIGLLIFSMRSAGISRFAAGIVLVNFVQILALYYNLTAFDWPGGVNSMFNVVSIVNLNIELAAPECSLSGTITYMHKWVLTLFLPALFGIILMTVFWAIRLYAVVADNMVAWAGRTHPHWTRSSVKDARVLPFGQAVTFVAWYALSKKVTSADLRTIKHACIRSTFLFGSLSYIPLTAAALEYMDCSKLPDGSWSLDAAPSRACYTDEYWEAFPAAVFAFFLYGLGMPAGLYYLLRFKRRSLSAQKFKRRYAFMTARFQDEFFWFELLVMLRKILVVIVVLFLDDNPFIQVALGEAALFACLLFQMRVRPYKQKRHNILEEMSLITLMGVLFLGLFFLAELSPDAARRDFAVTFIILGFSLVFGVALSMLAFDLYETRNGDDYFDRNSRNTLTLGSEMADWTASGAQGSGETSPEMSPAGMGQITGPAEPRMSVRYSQQI